MLKIYICFSSKEEMDNFIIDFLSLQSMLNGSDNVKRSKKKQLLIQKNIHELLTNIEDGLYFKLYRHYPGGNIPEGVDTSIPWTFPGLFARGIRSIYMKKSYMNRPGIWLSIDLRNTAAGREKYDWIVNNVHKSKIGLNVPLPKSYILKQRLEKVNQIISSQNPYLHAEKALEYLIEIKEKMPKMFKGKNVFVWEDMARVFDSMDILEKAVFCFETQAELMPGYSDPYLNLAVLYKSRGYVESAIDANLKGLEVNPKDEYIYYNLSSLLLQHGMYHTAIRHINSAILENPDRGLNHYLKGDIHFNRHEYHAAITSYEWALALFDEAWKSLSDECIQKLAVSYERIGNMEQAAKMKSQFNFQKGCNDEMNTTQSVLGKLFYDTGELRYEGQIKDGIPYGNGIKYFKSGQKEMEGIFGDWLIECGKEYYPNGNLKFQGKYNSGPRKYYGPRYYIAGRLFYETGELWYEGTFNIQQHGSIGYPIFKGSDSFREGIEYSRNGRVLRIFTDQSQ